ncbi:MAG: inositol monophosphatase family protein [Opitutales bacterium]|jgi:fructose-1,6-bisphosphatase/inositol monophosphatase family enzyme|nr:inositol monophosphatase family protein [Opitutales bacterium]MDG2168156.1 inositol monophosphatase family protein [Opitutales bacterium]
MKLSTEDLQVLSDQACLAATEAGALIASYRDRAVKVREKIETAGESLAFQVVTEVDERSEEMILELLAPTVERFDLAVLTEEREDDLTRLKKDYFWCIDPLDGTLPFTRGIPGYAVSISLVCHDGHPVIGVVFDPVAKKLFRAVEDAGVQIDGVSFQSTIRAEGPLKFFCDCNFSLHPEREVLTHEVEQVATQEGYDGVEVIEGAGAVLNACKVLEQGPAIYFKKPKPKNGGGSLWDFAATACLFVEAGLYARDFAGQPLDLNRAGSTFMNHRGVCYASTPELAATLRGIG